VGILEYNNEKIFLNMSSRPEMNFDSYSHYICKSDYHQLQFFASNVHVIKDKDMQFVLCIPLVSLNPHFHSFIFIRKYPPLYYFGFDYL
jgi:hypothetical protein